MLYFFEVKKKKEESWTLACLTLPANANIFGVDPELPERKKEYMTYLDRPELNLLPELPETEKATFIRKKIGETRFANRERYREVTGGRWQ
jgi:hypothetical protein